jgi:sugar (pentulose or hexulose) kinase
MDLLMGIDIGTSSTKAIVTDSNGKEIASASTGYSIERQNLYGQNVTQKPGLKQL